MKVLLISFVIFLLFEIVDARRNSRSAEIAWLDYVKTYNRSYNKIEFEYRREIFFQNYKKIAALNRVYKKKDFKFSCAVNRFADMSTEEFVASHTGLISAPRERKKLGMESKDGSTRMTLENGKQQQTFLPAQNKAENVDWRDLGAVTPVRHQRQCGSCWAFAAANAIEGQLFKKTKKLVTLSPQNLLDCVITNDTAGCEGGLMTDAYSWIMKNGINSERDYPYDGSDWKGCRYRRLTKITSIRNFVELPESDELELEKAVKTIGPISVGVEASFPSLQFYSSGIYFEPQYAVLVVGYGVENGTAYWLIKNSWGVRWGENGYFRLAKGQDNHCGVATYANYPIL